jgi:hypothetical protein
MCLADVARANDRQARGIAFGPFSIAPLFRDGRNIEWGCRCGLHTNGPEDRTTCTKWVTYGVRGDVSPDRARLLCKQWLISGLSLTSRRAHKALQPRKLEVLPEAELDRLAALALSDAEAASVA